MEFNNMKKIIIILAAVLLTIAPAAQAAEITAPDNTRRIHLRKVVKSRSGSILDFGIGTKQFVYFGFYDGDE